MKTLCWEWTGGALKSGYGEVTFQGKTQSTHRVAWFLTYGNFPNPCGLHHCDNRICVRPDHLYEGTRKRNYKDMVKRGRRIIARGEKVAGAKLTASNVVAIRNDKRVQSLIAQEYGIDTSTISNIKTRKTWKHV